MTDSELFELTPKQQKAFNRLKRAHADCLRLGVRFYNSYGTLGAVDGAKFKDHFFGDDDGVDPSIPEGDACNLNEFRLGCGEWADDCHWFYPKEDLGEYN